MYNKSKTSSGLFDIRLLLIIVSALASSQHHSGALGSGSLNLRDSLHGHVVSASKGDTSGLRGRWSRSFDLAPGGHGAVVHHAFNDDPPDHGFLFQSQLCLIDRRGLRRRRPITRSRLDTRRR